MPHAKIKKHLLPKQSVLKTQKNAYKIVELLGSGGFGNVYKVELKVMEECNAISDPMARKHFIELVDKGHNEECKFIVMGLVGYSLEKIRKDICNENMKLSTIIGVALQTLEALKDLHEIGYIHRDVKPHNYAIGMPPLEEIVYILDFGISRRWADDDMTPRVPRSSVKFFGTIRFASRSSHQLKEQGRCDDIEAWLYMIYELFDPKNLAWRKMSERADVLTLKMAFFDETLFKQDLIRAPADLKRLVKHVDSLSYVDQPNYAFIEQCLLEIARKYNVNINEPMEWVGKKPEKKIKEEDESSSARERRNKKPRKLIECDCDLREQCNSSECDKQKVTCKEQKYLPRRRKPSVSRRKKRKDSTTTITRRSSKEREKS